MNRLEAFDVTAITTPAMMRERIIELQYSGHYIESVEPMIDGKVQIVAKVLRPGMTEQKWTDIDFKEFWVRRREMIARREANKK